jgi:predicted membrane-bound spermidine synthase
MAIFDAKSNPPLHPDEMSYVLHKDKGPTVIIGAGGGRDVRAALKYGQKDIRAIEINPVIVEDVMGGKMRTYSGDLYSRPEVHVTIADGRSYVRQSTESFRNIVISLVDTAAASSYGALALAENSLYTVEGFEDDLAHLMPEGTLVVNRWDPEIDRLLAIASEALRREGSPRPADHLYACSAGRSTALLVKRTKLTAAELALLRQNCLRNHFVEVFAPDDPHGAEHARLVEMPAAEAAPDSASDVTPPTDDRPFFFYTLPPRRFIASLRDPATLAATHPAVLLLIGLAVVSSALAALALLVPLILAPGRILRAPDARARGRALGFFLAVGAGFSFVELALVQHFVMFLGHPTYALSTVLVALLLWAGVGSVLTARVSNAAAALSASRRAQLLVLVLALSAVGLGPVLERADALPFAARLAATIVLVAPIGVLIGSQTPLGVKLVAARAPDLIPWCWGLAGLAAVVACGIAPLLALNFGFAAVLLAGGLCYLAAALAAPVAAPASSDPVPVAVVSPGI